jgi:hypothetical protein
MALTNIHNEWDLDITGSKASATIKDLSLYPTVEMEDKVQELDQAVHGAGIRTQYGCRHTKSQTLSKQHSKPKQSTFLEDQSRALSSHKTAAATKLRFFIGLRATSCHPVASA